MGGRPHLVALPLLTSDLGAHGPGEAWETPPGQDLVGALVGVCPELGDGLVGLTQRGA
jgi:hypothetical protein